MCKPLLLVVLFLLLLFLADIIFNDKSSQQLDDGWSELVENSPSHEILPELVRKVKTIDSNIHCHFASECFDVYKCGNGKLKGRNLMYARIATTNYLILSSLHLPTRKVCL